MGLLLLIPGLILLLTSGLFAQQHTVGVILTVSGGILLAIQAIWFGFVLSKVNKGW